MEENKRMEKLVSIIISVYNSEKYVGECIESFIKQTYQNIELILIDDGSQDHSLEILNKYRDANSEKILVYSQSNEGVSSTRNKGVLYASGEYIIFADNDDYAEEDYVEKMVAELERLNADMIVGSYRKVDTNHKTLYNVKLSEDEWSKFRVVAPWARIIRKKFIEEKDLKFGNFRIGEDSFFSITAYNESNKIYVTSYIGYNWVQRESSVSNTVQKKGHADPLSFLEALIERNKQLKYVKGEYFEYFVIKFLIWNLYYISGNVEKTILTDYCEKYFKWLEKTYADYRANRLISPLSPKGEDFFVRLLVWILAKMNVNECKVMLCMIGKLKKVLRMKK